mmetsp:Transcript_9879/g.19271  ORF Transcript_9879/g.19271 Transcript_9879/m.19271 type:complete len:203 (+) Transcript_9879:320-928(+)
MMTVMSSHAVSNVFESGENARLRTALECPSSLRSRLPLTQSITCTAPSMAPLASSRPSGEYATLMMNLLCGLSTASGLSPCVPTPKTLTLPVWLPAATSCPCGCIATVHASTGPGSMSLTRLFSSRFQMRSRPSRDEHAHSRPSAVALIDTTPRKCPVKVETSSSFGTADSAFGAHTLTVSSIEPETILSSEVQSTAQALSS